MSKSIPSISERVGKICLALPQATCEVQGDHRTFRVSKKVFAYFLNNHHGDGIVSLCGKVEPGDNTMLVNAQPERFYLPAYIGPRGWVGLRLDGGSPDREGIDREGIDWEEVEELAKDSYRRTAPKKLAAMVKLGQ